MVGARSAVITASFGAVTVTVSSWVSVQLAKSKLSVSVTVTSGPLSAASGVCVMLTVTGWPFCGCESMDTV